jgi:hypothetical protein
MTETQSVLSALRAFMLNRNQKIATAKHTMPNTTWIALISLLFSTELRAKYFVSILIDYRLLF